jgi:hypothetical protein
MSILVGIDGTTADVLCRDNASYDTTFATSFVRKLCLPAGPDNPTPNRMYFRGPVLPGESNWCPNDGVLAAVRDGVNFIVNRRRNNEPVLLTGYSRGALGVCEIARRLQQPPHRIDVKAILLFDCVDMHRDIDAPSVTSNVRNVLHAVLAEGVRSRNNWNRAARGPQDPAVSVYRNAEFRCTHAGIGGVPWPLPTRREPGPPPREVPDHSRQNELIFEFGSGQTNITYAQDNAESGRILNDRVVAGFIRDHGFQ